MPESLDALLALANTPPTAEDLAEVIPPADASAPATPGAAAGTSAPPAASAPTDPITTPPATAQPDTPVATTPAEETPVTYTDDDYAGLQEFAAEIGWDGELPEGIEPTLGGFAQLFQARDAQRQAEVAAYADPTFQAFAQHLQAGGSWDTFRQKLEAAQPIALAEDDITAQEALVLADLKAKGLSDKVAQRTMENLRDAGELYEEAQAIAAASQQARLQNAHQATAAEVQARQEAAQREQQFVDAQVQAIAVNNFDGYQMPPAQLARYKASLQPDASGTPEIDVVWNSLTPAENARLEAFALQLYDDRKKAPAPTAPRPTARPASSLVRGSGKAEGTGDALGDLNSLAQQMRSQDRQNASNTR